VTAENAGLTDHMAALVIAPVWVTNIAPLRTVEANASSLCRFPGKFRDCTVGGITSAQRNDQRDECKTYKSKGHDLLPNLAGLAVTVARMTPREFFVPSR
jgi:hypothetical protein